MYKLFSLFILAGFLQSCEDSTGTRPSPGPYNYARINTFTKDRMTDQYFWAEEVKDKNIDPDSNPEEYFATMKYGGHVSRDPAGWERSPMPPVTTTVSVTTSHSGKKTGTYSPISTSFTRIPPRQKPNSNGGT